MSLSNSWAGREETPKSLQGEISSITLVWVNTQHLNVLLVVFQHSPPTGESICALEMGAQLGSNPDGPALGFASRDAENLPGTFIFYPSTVFTIHTEALRNLFWFYFLGISCLDFGPGLPWLLLLFVYVVYLWTPVHVCACVHLCALVFGS